jgi:hypothetical protein
LPEAQDFRVFFIGFVFFFTVATDTAGRSHAKRLVTEIPAGSVAMVCVQHAHAQCIAENGAVSFHG